MSKLKVGDVLVHKTLGNQPLVVVEIVTTPVGKVDKILTRYAISGAHGIDHFVLQEFDPRELETPLESISREAEIFQALNAKRDEINNKPISKPGPVGISHLN